ncbi:MAG: adenylate kinase [Candidatus Micrarchaeota archaeon]|nr:adenylate kinase [Candidatus Micrarchaeota archaeon]
MKIVFLGPPGSGKGTTASRVAPKLGIPHISTGALFRENISQKTPIGIEAEKYVEDGKLVPDEIVMRMLVERLEEDNCKKGFILDGVPRTLPQAEMLEKMTGIDIVIYLDVPDDIVIARNSARVSCEKCGRIYNLRTLPPKKEGVCDVCGGKLVRRPDDEPDVIRERLEVYRKETAPLIDFYKQKGILRKVKCDKIDEPPEVVVGKVMGIVDGI